MGDKVDKDELLKAKGYLPAPKVIEKLGVHHTTLYRWINKGKLKAMRVGGTGDAIEGSGGRLYVNRKSLIEFLGKEASEVFGFVAA